MIEQSECTAQLWGYEPERHLAGSMRALGIGLDYAPVADAGRAVVTVPCGKGADSKDGTGLRS